MLGCLSLSEQATPLPDIDVSTGLIHIPLRNSENIRSAPHPPLHKQTPSAKYPPPASSQICSGRWPQPLRMQRPCSDAATKAWGTETCSNARRSPKTTADAGTWCHGRFHCTRLGGRNAWIARHWALLSRCRNSHRTTSSALVRSGDYPEAGNNIHFTL